MEKELEHLKEIRNHLDLEYYRKYKYEGLDNLETALTELQAIKEAKPSEALKKLEEIRERFNDDSKGNNSWGFKISQELNIIKDALLKAQEQEKVLEVIFEKRVEMFNLKVAIDNNSLRLYNNTISNAFKHLRLTQEEFETLKRWCEKCQMKS